MRQYQCNKIVEAEPIVEIFFNVEGYYELLLQNDETMYMPPEWFMKHEPEEGGYFVRYRDGYESYSPAEPFEEGYEELN